MADTEPITLTIGVPGHSDVVLLELDSARGWLEAKGWGSLTREETLLFLSGLGLGVLQSWGWQRSTPAGAGFDPEWRP